MTAAFITALLAGVIAGAFIAFMIGTIWLAFYLLCKLWG